MSDVDDLAATLALGDPAESVPTDVLNAMAEAAVRAFWIPCPHTDWITETNFIGTWRFCQRCGAKLVVEGATDD